MPHKAHLVMVSSELASHCVCVSVRPSPGGEAVGHPSGGATGQGGRGQRLPAPHPGRLQEDPPGPDGQGGEQRPRQGRPEEEERGPGRRGGRRQVGGGGGGTLKRFNP